MDPGGRVRFGHPPDSSDYLDSLDSSDSSSSEDGEDGEVEDQMEESEESKESKNPKNPEGSNKGTLPKKEEVVLDAVPEEVQDAEGKSAGRWFVPPTKKGGAA